MQPELTQLELRRMADRMLAEANRAFDDEPVPANWVSKYQEQVAVNATLQATVARHIRRRRREKWFFGVALALVVVAFLVGRWSV